MFSAPQTGFLRMIRRGQDRRSHLDNASRRRAGVRVAWHESITGRKWTRVLQVLCLLCHKVAVVREDKLEAMKSKLATVTSVHVYSIQKALLKDSGPLYNTDYDIIKTNLHDCSKFSAIRCADAVPRTPAEVAQARALARAGSQAPSDNTSAANAPALNGHGPSAPKQSSQQPKGIMGMFAAKAASKAQDASKEPKAKEAPSVSAASSKPSAKGNIMNNFFGKAAMNKLKVNSVPEQPKEEKEVAKTSVPVAQPESSPNTIVEKPGRKTEPAKIQAKDKKSKMKRVDKSDNEEEREPENQKKKRKRIKQLESDSSDEEDVLASPTLEEEKAPSPPAPVPALKAELEPPSTEASAGGKKRKRKRVLKSKMFVDEEEGCMVTEKVYESESCTDSEDDFAKAKPPAAPKQPALPVKKEPKEERKNQKKGAATASRANKQVSIMGFFQKK
ncbi:DNA polymerase delta subunit 3 isoform X2 [Numida meleagris]|uniref:DNA polymerase delta subunit 3 isoform X2 n=1 Tax=Numida meleagris TaxID=8996 RepID=UPI000B3E2E0B|nr:DNA polymerase delta subunit 3 isoform X2 [Numida meleagris]